MVFLFHPKYEMQRVGKAAVRVVNTAQAAKREGQHPSCAGVSCAGVRRAFGVLRCGHCGVFDSRTILRVRAAIPFALNRARLVRAKDLKTHAPR